MFQYLSLGLLWAPFFLAGLARADDNEKAGPNDNKPPAGFTALFNGTDLNGWQGLVEWNKRAKDPAKYAEQVEAANKKFLPHWQVIDGLIVYDGKGQSLQTAKDYGDFELYVDWKILPKGDSGIYLRGQPQVQIWDSDNLGKGLEADKGKGSGGLWNNPRGSKGQTPLKKADRPVDEWNTFRIIMKGDEATIYLNG